jgi:hypothetical protein
LDRIHAYVFWHQPQREISTQRYESRLRVFHQELSCHRPKGFRFSMAFAVVDAPWLEGRSGYEDWYVLQNSDAIDALEQAATSVQLFTSHRGIASISKWGSGALYRHLQGPHQLSGGSAQWTSRREEVPSSCPIWQRRLAIGPAPEFCVVGGEPTSAAPGVVTDRRVVWPE